jgi:AbrB family looped-hinge helix DNA binding protein
VLEILWVYLLDCGIKYDGGKKMGETTITVKIDEKGRIIIPRRIRKAAQLKEGSYINVRSKGKTIIIEPIEPVADKYFGAFKVTKSTEDLDEFAVEVKKEWRQKKSGT